MEAVDFALSFDDGQHLDGIEEADVILVGVSRTSKTPTCIFLARRGIRAANVPYVPGTALPERLLKMKGPLIVGLTESPERLVQLRRNRLKADGHDLKHENSYLDPEKVEAEILNARKLFSKCNWPVIDVTRRSVEETAAEDSIFCCKSARTIKISRSCCGSLILASQSRARKTMLEQAGLVFEAVPAGLDEKAITEDATKEAGVATEDIALVLARGKALAIAAPV